MISELIYIITFIFNNKIHFICFYFIFLVQKTIKIAHRNYCVKDDVSILIISTKIILPFFPTYISRFFI